MSDVFWLWEAQEAVRLDDMLTISYQGDENSTKIQPYTYCNYFLSQFPIPIYLPCVRTWVFRTQHIDSLHCPSREALF